VDEALAVSGVDLTIIEGRRTLARQRQLVARGASRTLNSRHLTGHAVDLAPLRAGRIPWNDPDAWYDLATTLQAASVRTGVEVVWGGVWDRRVSELDPCDIEGEVIEYRQRYRAARMGRSPLFDGPHVQLCREMYP
jgi:peptidoglycan L-alanyl-D-glutamate endopeptidase CwlK